MKDGDGVLERQTFPNQLIGVITFITIWRFCDALSNMYNTLFGHQTLVYAFTKEGFSALGQVPMISVFPRLLLWRRPGRYVRSCTILCKFLPSGAQ